MSRSPSTNTAVAIYREAARIIERRQFEGIVGGYSCLAVMKAADPAYDGRPSEYWKKPVVRAYSEMFAPREGNGERLSAGDFPGPDDTRQGRGPRILALCFMAAMVEAGDA